MNNTEKQKLRKEIKDIRIQTIEEVLQTFKYFIGTYFSISMTFGQNSYVTEDVIVAWKEFKKIIKEENSLMTYLLKKSEDINYQEALLFLDELDAINDDTIMYYYNMLDNFEDAADVSKYQQEALTYRATRPTKNFDTIIETDHYRNHLYGLTLSMEDIKIYLSYPDSFWQFIKDKTLTIKSENLKNYDNGFYGVLIKCDENNNLVSFKIIVPEIVNLATVLINIHEYKHAYDLYQLLGMPINETDPIYEESAKEVENDFVKCYLPKYKSK